MLPATAKYNARGPMNITRVISTSTGINGVRLGDLLFSLLCSKQCLIENIKGKLKKKIGNFYF